MRTLEAAARRLNPPPGLPALWLVSDPARLPDPLPAAARLARRGGAPGRPPAGVLARGLAPAVLARLARLARGRGLVLLVAGEGRAALRLRAGLHLPERRASTGLLPFLRARRARRPWARLSLAAHGGAAGAARARRLGADLAFLSPAFPTASHPGQAALGPLRWAALARGLPGGRAAALGGVGPRTAWRLPRARLAGLAAIAALTNPCGSGATVSRGCRDRGPTPVAPVRSADP